MQFVPNGPDIPNALLQEQEDGRVVFFCGAGISYPAGLPGFKGLVDDIYQRLGTTPSIIEKEVYDRGQFDATLDLLERRLPGQRVEMRRALAAALQPKWRRRGATDTHTALLQLARAREGSLRLVTTNFDRIFDRAAKRVRRPVHAYAAPMLPIPKNSRWDGLVYLHGLLPSGEDDTALQRLVLTSGDFGLAYLTERWAARFIGELFRNYVVCFVGYSINDPVLRYMMDALAADRMQGEITPQAYAMGDCEPGKENDKTIEWQAKGVTPVLYHVPTGSHDHSLLHKTLTTWAETYRDGTLGKERIVVEYALARPSASSREDDFVGRMLWALSHRSGLPAKHFAELNPVPPLDWLEALSEDRYQHGDLRRFGVPPHNDVDAKLLFSLVRRPTPYPYAPWMELVSAGSTGARWDDVMFHLARWLVRHLNDPVLLLWFAERGGQPHPQWRWLVEREMDRLATLAREGRVSELDEIVAAAPNAVPEPLMRKLWRILLVGRVKSPGNDLAIYQWHDHLKLEGLTPSLRLELRELLSPRVTLRKPFRWPPHRDGSDSTSRVRRMVDWDLELAADQVHSALQDAAGSHWRVAVPLLLEDFQLLLRDALDLMHELGGADEHQDRSYADLPSITPHLQNRGFRDWVVLIELLRDAWLATREAMPERAHRIALQWFELPYPTFKRLAFFAASHDNNVRPERWVQWLLSDGAWWLWSVGTQRETLRLLVQQGRQLPPSARALLETAILAGPPRHMFRDDLEPERWQSLVDHSVWLHLAKLRESTGELGQAASHRFEDLSLANPAWQLAEDQRDGFPVWISGTGDPDYGATRHVDIAPRRRAALVEWLRHPPAAREPFSEDTWRDTCRTRFFLSFLALCDLASGGTWPQDRWGVALQAWSEESQRIRSWRFAAPLVQSMPEAVFAENINAVSWWMEAAAKSIDRHEPILLDLCRRVLALHMALDTGIGENDEPLRDPVTDAINHPVGHATQALLDLWFKRQPGDNSLLPPDIEPLFTRLTDVAFERFRHGRVILASRLIALFRVDRSWAEQRLLPLFDWATNPVEAKAAWEGFLWSPRLYRPLLVALKAQFLSTARHYLELGDHARQFATFLTYAALDPGEGYTPADFQEAIQALPQEGLQEVAQALSQALEGSGAQREEYWRHRILPFWQRVWPKSRELASPGIADALARVAIAAGQEFPSAVSAVLAWMRPIEHPHYVVRRLRESGLCADFPEDALRLLDAIVAAQPWAQKEFRQCLEEIAGALPDVVQDVRYQRLNEYLRRQGL